MKKIALLFTILLIGVSQGWAQNVQWGFNVLGYSSQKDAKEYSAVQAIGRPNVLPAAGDDVRAWQPKPKEKESYIKIGFLTPVIPKQLIIAESLNPGHISQVFVYDAAGKEYPIKNLVRTTTTAPSRFYTVNSSEIKVAVSAVKVVLKHENLDVGIDAIGITESDQAYKLKTSPNDLIKANMVATKLSNNVNSKYTDMGPLVSPDGKTLYFSRRGDPADIGGKKDEEDIWYANWDETSKKWGVAQNIGKPLNNKDPNFVNSISPDGNTILLGNTYTDDGDMEDGVSISQRTDTGWGAPRRLIIEDDSKNISLRANYFMSNSQKILLMSQDRKGDSYGDRDLYVSFIKSDNTWTKPLNLGTTVNTKATDAAPFLASDDKTLYYTSNGLNGYGGSDIYMTRRLDDTWQKWSEPENLGPVVNSSHNESFFSLSASGNQVYFTSETDDDKNNVDMFMIVLPPILKPYPVMLVDGRVLNSKTNEPIAGARIFFEDLTTGQEVGIASSSYPSGEYKIVLPSGKNYGYLAEREGFVSVNSNIDLTTMGDYKEFKKDLYLTPIEVGQTIVINNIFFDFDKTELRKESFLELNRLVAILKKNTTMKIEVSGNTDNVGTEAYNDHLSIKRAEAVVNYLTVKSGIDKSRIAMKHYGEQKPIATNATATGRQLNRRVEFKILSK